jgi:heat shock protein HslJ
MRPCPAARARRRALVALAGVLALMLVAAACGDDDDNASTGGSGGGSGPPLEGTAWELSADSPLGVTTANVTLTAQFEDGTVSGYSGCNTYNGPYTVDGSDMTIGPDLASTQMACPGAQMEVEQEFLTRLSQVAGFEIDNDTLTLSDDEGEVLLRFQATDRPAAIQGEWEVTGYYAGTAITSVLGDATLTAEFGEDGTVSGNTGCNTFSGPYEIDGENITIGPLATTLAACPTPELDRQQANYLAALDLARTFEVAGGQLTLFREGHTIAVSYVTG